MDTHLDRLKQFRSRLYQSLPRRADAIMDLIDALSANTIARSVVELSLSPLFRRGHSSLHDAIDAVLQNPGHSPYDNPRRDLEESLLGALLPELPLPSARPFWLFALDALSLSRPHARTLQDRSYVHKSDPGPSGTPVTVGHAYSLLVVLPERQPDDPPWAPVLSSRRVPSKRTAGDVGVEQIWDVLAVKDAPWTGQLVVCVIDSGYGNAPFLSDLADEPDLVLIPRLRGNRVFYHQPVRDPASKKRGAWYGKPFDLRKKKTWPEPDEVATKECQRAGGRTMIVEVRAWRDMLMSGTKQFRMHCHPFTLLRIECRDAVTGKPIFRRAMWLGVMGARRGEISLQQAFEAYLQRSDQEHSHRFLRQRLLLDAFQTPVTQHEENWILLSRLAHTSSCTLPARPRGRSRGHGRSPRRRRVR